jgi:flagellar hook-length control protein FliK
VPETAQSQPADAATSSPVTQLANAASLVYRATPAQQQVTVTLDPAELGAITFKLSTNSGGHSSLDIAVERPETLKLLLADSDTLHRALDQAGVPAENRSISIAPAPSAQSTQLDAKGPDSGSAQFSGGSAGDGGSRGQGAGSQMTAGDGGSMADTAEEQATTYRTVYSRRALDIVA